MDGLLHVCVHSNDLLALTNSALKNHSNELNEALKGVQEAGLKVNVHKSFFCQTQLECLGHWIARQGSQTLPKKVEAMQKIAGPNNKSDLWSFIGLVNCHHDSWIRHSDLLVSSAQLMGELLEWQWTEVKQKAFETIKQVVAGEVPLVHPDFLEKFAICICKLQIAGSLFAYCIKRQ